MTRVLARVTFHATSFIVVFGLAALHAERIGDYDLAAGDRLPWVVLYASLCAFVGYAFGLPDQPTARSRVRAAAATSLVSPLLFAVVQVLSGGNLIPRFVLLLSIPVLFIADVLVATLVIAMFRSVSGRERVLIIGSPDAVARTTADAEEHLEIPCSIVGGLQPAVIDFADRFGAIIDRERVSLVVVSSDALDDECVLSVLSRAHASGVRVRTINAFYDEWIGKVPLHELGSAALLFDVREIHHVGYTRLSRLMDISLALFGVVALVIALPFVLLGDLVANRGPLLFGQERVGRDQRVFTIWKFRTMRPGPSTGEWTQADDPRITRFGRFLRRTHVDELPQVFNILRGDLSVVGPRPEQPKYVEQLKESIPFYRTRHVVRPGLTGWAQVNYPYGANEVDAYEKLQYELWYLGHQSFLLDLRILARTARHVVGSRGR